MKRLFPLLLLSLLLPQLAFAQERPVVDRLYVDPPVIYENEPFDIVAGGFFPGIEPPVYVHRFQSTFNIELPDSPGGPLISVPWGERLRFEGLVAGTYSIAVHGLDRTHRVIDFVVHEKPFTLSSRIGEEADEIAIEGLPVRDCPNDTCPALTVYFGNTPGHNVRVEYPHSEIGNAVIVVEVPEGTGLVDVSVQLLTGERPVLRNAFRYGRGLESDYERVLFPITYAGAGAHGSEWRSDILVRNDAPVRVRTEPLIYLEMLLPDLQAMMPLPPGARSLFPSANRDGGAFLHVARGGEKWLTYASHAVDRSRTNNDRGSEVPVVRAEDTASEIRLLDIPMRPLFRSHLRIYDFDEVREQSLAIVFRKEDGTEFIEGVQLPPTPVCVNPPCLADRPSYVGIDLGTIRELENAGNVDITIRASTNDRRIWAFVSVANNETQRVTLYTPQHKTPTGAIR